MVQTLKTKGNAALKKKLKKQAGFTLVELLIVVAIIAILAAVAIPAYSAAMESSRETTDLANARAASSLAASDYLLQNYSGTATYTFVLTGSESLAIGDVTGVTPVTTTLETGTDMDADTAQSTKGKAGGTLTVVVTDGVVDSNSWITALT